MDNKKKIQTYGGWFLILGMAIQIIFMMTLLAIYFRDKAAMAVVIQLNLWIGFISLGLVMLVIKIWQIYAGLRNRKLPEMQADQDGYIEDYKILGIKAVYLQRFWMFCAGVGIGVMFWTYPFMGMLLKK